MPFRLGDTDRAKFDLDDWLDYDVRRISVADLEELSERYDFDPTDWPDPLLGALTLEQAGDPDAKPKPPRWRNRAIVWMLLRQNGVQATWEQAGEAFFTEIMYRAPEEAEVGKGESPPSTGSPPSGGSTTRRSRSSSASVKKR